MTRILLMLAMAGAVAAPVFAMDAMSADKMSCADYIAMDSAGQMKSVDMMKMGGSGSADSMSSGSMSASSKMSTDDMMMTAETDCAAHPDMMVGDAMKASKM